jgi:hypothetical protein
MKVSFQFIYLQQPFSNHPNNLRGQIFRDLRRGLPPAAERPQQAWPSVRAWPILAGCWAADPLSRPSAFTIAYMLRRTSFTFPTTVFKRIVHFVDITWGRIHFDSLPTWEERCKCLRHLCLVSTAYRTCVTPILYRAIWLDMGEPWRLPALLSSLESSTTKALLSPQEADGYGVCTEMLTLPIPEKGPYQRNISVRVRDVLSKLPGLRLLNIDSYMTPATSFELPSLTTLTLSRVDLAILFDHIPTLQALESFQRLSISACHDSTPSRYSLQEPLPKVYLPNLLEISFYAGTASAKIKPFTTISTWTMPRLGSLHFRETPVVAASGSLLLDFFTLLQTHGRHLQYLTLACTHLREQDISTLLALCSGLHSLHIDSPVSLFLLSTSHAHLERIRVRSGLTVRSMSYRNTSVAVDALESLKLKAGIAFPKLSYAEIIVGFSGDIRYRSATVSLRTGDRSITGRCEGKTYTLSDGQSDFSGAYFGQAVDCADFAAFGCLSTPLEVNSTAPPAHFSSWRRLLERRFSHPAWAIPDMSTS